MLAPNIQVLKGYFLKNYINLPKALNTSRYLKIVFCYFFLCGISLSINAQDTSKAHSDTIRHRHKITEIYCKIVTTSGHLQNETFHIYLKDRLIHKLTIMDFITEYYFPIYVEGWHPVDEFYAYLDDNHKDYYHFKKRKRKDGVYEYDLVIDLERIKKIEKRHKKHGH